MIAASFKQHWPADRLARLHALQNEARSRGLRLKARNGGGRLNFLAHMAFWQGKELASQHWDIAKAESWLASYSGEVR